MTPAEKLEDLLVSQMQMLRLRLVYNATDIDKYITEIKRQKGIPKGLLIAQLQALRISFFKNIDDIDKYMDEIEKIFKRRIKT